MIVGIGRVGSTEVILVVWATTTDVRTNEIKASDFMVLKAARMRLVDVDMTCSLEELAVHGFIDKRAPRPQTQCVFS